MTALLLLAMSGGLAPGCGGNASSTIDVPPEDVPGTLAGAVCDASRACLGLELDIALAGADCVAQAEERARSGELSLLPDAVHARRVTFDGTRVAACADAIRAAGCDVALRRMSVLCDYSRGTVASGGDCALDAECDSGLFCKTDAACPGTCTPLLAAGAACTRSDDCWDGLACLDATRTCTKPAKEGAACGSGTGAVCGPGLVCSGATSTASGRCVRIRDAFSGKEGAACNLRDSVLCEAGLSCAILGVNDAGTDFVMRCEKPGKGPSCHYALPSECPEGEFCETIDATGTDGACKPLPAEGDPCVSRSPTDPSATIDLCAPGALCIGGTCTKPRHTKASCTSASECLSSVCTAGACAASACSP
jgi:hypothetical protein